MEIRCVLIDDEDNNLENIQRLLQQYYPGITIAGTANSADEGIQLIAAVKPNLVLLDIQMPGKSGFDLLRSISTIDFEVIFITAYDQYGIQAIKFSALDYLLKPVDINELKQAVEKARQKLALREQNRNVSNLIAYLKMPQQEPPKIALPTQQETHYVKVNEIIRCEASDNYTNFFLPGGEKILVSKTLKEFADLLKPHGFLRTHQSHLVNMSHVKSFLKEEGGQLLLQDKTKIPISRQNLELVKKTLNDTLHS
jgi:two-component system LytT family response regulator